MGIKTRVLVALMAGVLAVGIGVEARADIVIDFEDPLFGFGGRQIMDPYVDQGVSFTAEPFPGTSPLDEVTGLVYNERSNACVEPANRDVKLGTGRELVPPNGRVGLDGYPIKATLSTPIVPNRAQGDQVEVSVDFQTVVGREVRMRLYNSSNQQVGEATGTVSQNQGDCGKLGSPRGTIRITAVTQEEVAFVRFDIPDNILGGIAYVIDNVQVRFVLGTQRMRGPVEEFCARLARNSGSLPFTLHTANDCQVLASWEDLGGGEVKGYVANMMKIQVLSGRDLCNMVGGCTPCPIPQFICPNLEFVFSDVHGHDLEFSTTFTFYAFNLDAELIGTGQRLGSESVRLFFSRPTIHSSGEEESFFIVMRPHQQGLPWKFDFWGRVELISTNTPDPLKQFDRNGNLRIDNDEFYRIMDQWTNGFIPDQLFFAGLDYWTNQLPIGSAGGAAKPVSFNVQSLGRAMLFSASNAKSMSVSIYDTQGRRVYQEQSVGSRLAWNMENASGVRVANGVYFVQMTSEDSSGRVHQEIVKIAVVN